MEVGDEKVCANVGEALLSKHHMDLALLAAQG